MIEFSNEQIVSAVDSLTQIEFVETNKKPGVPPVCKVKDKQLSETAAKCLGIFHQDLAESANGLNLQKPQYLSSAKKSRDHLVRSLQQKCIESIIDKVNS